MLKLLTLVEGFREYSYLDSLGNRTVGIGFNMDDINARKVWLKLNLEEDFGLIYTQKIPLSKSSSLKLVNHLWNWCEKKASQRCAELGRHYWSLPDYKRYILADIVFNTGSIRNWTKVIIKTIPKEVLMEARRTPHKLMDNRVAKIGRYYGIINTVEEARKLGLTNTTNI